MKKILRLCVAIILCAVGLAVSVGAADVLYSGTCGAEGDGSNLTWSLDSEGTLVIDGSGAMKNYHRNQSPAPWDKYRSKIKSVSICESVTSIGDYAFWECSNLTLITISGRVTSIGDLAFSGCLSISEITVDEDNQNYSSDERGVLFSKNKSKLIQYPVGNTATSYDIPLSVTSIGNYAFQNCNSLTSVKIPENVTEIGTGAFWNCSSLPSITISIGVTHIGDYSFYNCISLASVTIPSSVTNIGGYAFDGCSSLKSVYITDLRAWCEIKFGNDMSNPLCKGADLYINGEKATDIVIPFGTTEISDIAFSGYKSLNSVIIPEKVTRIGNSAFDNCENLKSVHIFEGVKTIGDGAFHCCYSLSYVTIPSSVTSIESFAFYFCSPHIFYYAGTEEDWKKIRINPEGNLDFTEAGIHYNSVPAYSSSADGVLDRGTFGVDGDNLTWTLDSESALIIDGRGEMEFSSAPWHKYRSSIKTAYIGDGVTRIGDHAFSGCSITSVTIPSSVTSIGDHAFDDCDSLTSVTIPSSVTSIGESAFSGCSSLTSVTIPSSVTSIGYCAFYGCDNLQTVFYNGTIEQIDIIYISGGNEPLTRAMRFLGSTAAPQTHPVLSTDIRSYIYGSEIESYNVNGSTCVVAEELMNYGFTVVWDGNARTLSVTHPSEDFTQEIKRDFGAKTGSIGEKIAETVPTDIVTYVNGKVVPSFNIGGRTVIYIDSLAVFGGVVWDGGARTISLG